MIPAHTGAEEKKIEVRAKRFFFCQNRKTNPPPQKNQTKTLKTHEEPHSSAAFTPSQRAEGPPFQGPLQKQRRKVEFASSLQET